jgi:cytochrome c biogenesis protein CcdA/thiol-disulfide isomerase/thioredoxin
MLLLMTFALLAGAATAISPCVLPILPAVLGAGVTGGRRRPLGIVAGLVLSFTFAAVALVYVIDALGLPDDIQRTIAIVVLAGFGIALLTPPVSARIEAQISRLVGAPRMRRGEGFGSGLVLGGGLGLAYFPCAGPILAGVITVSAAQDFTVGRLAVVGAYAIGSGAVLYTLMLGGRRMTDRLKPIQGRVQMAMGAVMVAVAVLMAADLDIRFQNSVADDLPAFLTSASDRLQNSDAVAAQLDDVSGGNGGAEEAGAEQVAAGADLPDLGAAPALVDTGEWFNTDGLELEIQELTAEGNVVLIDFWTYTCINCIRTFPELKAWDERYREDGLVIIGVHTPEFPFEREAANVQDSIDQNELRYPVVQDNDFGTWDAFQNQFWPAKYLIDADGQIRYTHFGEGEYDVTEEAIRTLLAEAGEDDLGDKLTKANAEHADPGLGTPETYLGAARAEGYVNGRWSTGVNDFGRIGNQIVDQLPANALALQGEWRNSAEDATALKDARIDANYLARKVFLVLGSPDTKQEVEVLLDGKPIPDRLAGPDVEDGRVRVGGQRLYRLVDTGEAEQHVVSLELPRGVSAYAFTFG